MKILWIKTDFLHPTTRGGQIRTLEMLRRLHQRHEIHYVAYEDPDTPEGPRRACEYSTRWYAVKRRVPRRGSPRFALQAAVNLFSQLPLPVSRYQSRAMKSLIARLLEREKFDSVVSDFLFPVPSVPDVSRCVLFQHNLETAILERHAQHASGPLPRAYFELQARRMRRLEQDACRRARRVIAVSETDAAAFRAQFGAERVSAIPTGVDIGYFAPSGPVERRFDLVFAGSMDWLPNIDAMLFFAKEIFPLILKERPETTLAIVGRKPTAEVTALASDPRVTVTGTVPDMRPYFWGSAVSIVPLRIGGGTRLKIYEAMAARVPVVSTPVGAEGLAVRHPENIRLAESPAAFARECLDLLADAPIRERMAAAAFDMVSASFSWDRVVEEFESRLR